MLITDFENAPALLGVREISELLGVCTDAVWKMCRRGELPAVKIGKRWYVKKTDLLAKFEVVSE